MGASSPQTTVVAGLLGHAPEPVERTPVQRRACRQPSARFPAFGAALFPLRLLVVLDGIVAPRLLHQLGVKRRVLLGTTVVLKIEPVAGKANAERQRR